MSVGDDTSMCHIMWLVTFIPMPGVVLFALDSVAITARRFWHKCEVKGKANQVHQLKLLQKITLMKNSEFCEDMSIFKKKNADRITLIIHL